MSINFFEPDLAYSDVYNIDFDDLYNKGIRVLFFDIDNAIATYSESVPSNKLENLFSVLNSKFEISIISNGKSERIRRFADILHVRNEGNAKKPLTFGLKNSAEVFGRKPYECAIIGDQIFTDIWAGKNFHCRTVYVKPINTEEDPPFVKLKRIFEKPVIRKMKFLK